MSLRILLILSIITSPILAKNQSDSLAVPTDSVFIPGTEVSFSMTLVPGGTFLMGSAEDDLNHKPDEGPQFEVAVDSFWIGTYEVSYQEYNIFRDKELDLPPSDTVEWNADAFARPSPPYEDPTFGMGKDEFPAVSMTQFAALQYCKWLSEKNR